MKKMKLFAAVLALVMLTAAAVPSLAMTDADWVWYLLRDYGGRSGKNGCYLVEGTSHDTFTATQVDETAPTSARLMVQLLAEKAGDQIDILLAVAIENGYTGEYLSGYDFTNLTINVDGTEFYWTDMVSNTASSGGWYSTIPGLTLLVPEIAFYQKVKDAKDITVTAKVDGRYGRETFRIDNENKCGNFKEFCRVVIEYKLHDFCYLGVMNAIAQRFPMHTDMGAAGYSYGQKLSVVNCNSSISFRTKPNPDAPKYCMIPKGEIVTFLEDAGNGFFKIEYNGRTGYASALYLGW